MSQTVTVNIPHKLGKQEARRRIQSGFVSLVEPLSTILAIDRQEWRDDRLEFAATALGQKTTGAIEVEEGLVRLAIELPRLLAALVEKAKPLIEKRGRLLLENK